MGGFKATILGSVVLAVVGAGLTACEPAGNDGAGAQVGPSDDGLASVELALTVVPTSVQCVRVTATPAAGTVTTKTFTVTSGSASTTLTMGLLAPGSYTMAGDAFTSACSSISGAGPWIADPVATVLRAGATTALTLNFRKNSPIVVSANFLNNVQGISVGSFATYVMTDAGLVSAGVAGPTFSRATFSAFDPTTVPGNAVVAIANVLGGACAIRVDGTVWCWGQNNSGDLGPGIPNDGSLHPPTQIAGLSGATLIAGGQLTTCVAATGASGLGVYCWGDNSGGQFGNGTTTSGATPVLAHAGAVKALACGDFATYIVTLSGAVRSWGSNNFGQLGDSTTVSRLTEGASLDTAAVQSVVAGGFFACSLHADGSVRCWGDNQEGELGTGTTTNSAVPLVLNGLNARQLTGGDDHACAITATGQTVCWGSNVSGQVGDGTGVQRLTPTPVPLPGVTATAIASCPIGASTCVISSTFDVYCWGANSTGNLGDGTMNVAFLPVRPILR